MGFPATKTVKNNFELADDVNPKQVTIINTFFDRLQNYNLEKLEKETDSISFISRNSLFKIPYAIKLSFAIKKKLEITYHINMMELLKSCVIVAIIAAFFSSMSIERFIILFVLLVSGFYVFNVFVIENGLKRTINEVFKKTPFAEKDTTISEQHSWMSDTSRCPACGEYIGDNVNECPSCKLSLPMRKAGNPLYKQWTGKREEPQINYVYKENKKKKD